MKTLIIEFNHEGHYPEYLKHILTYMNETGEHDNFLIYLTPLLRKQIEQFENTQLYDSIQFFNDSVISEFNKCKTSAQIANFIFYQILEINKNYTINQVVFLNLNMVVRSSSISNPFKKLPFNFSGVFFQSPYRLRQSKKFPFRLFKREGILRLLSLNKNCNGIYILNDKQGANYYSKWSDKIKFIPDPVKIVPSSNLNIYKYHNIKPCLLTFLHIGALGKYKGTQEVISAIENIDTKLINKVHFLLVGKMDKALENLMLKINKNNKSRIVSVRNEFISEEDFTAYVKQCNAILIANKNVESSSGIINHCLSNNKVVIAPNLGYYKDVLEDYSGAILFDEKFKLGNAIRETFNNFNSLKSNAVAFNQYDFIETHSYRIFATILLK